uniref:ER membrane protein complex subunit 2 n=1 Tax=Rhizochromulina marina TaxID=1034831 RepID=A0A7S2S8F2_9STRA
MGRAMESLESVTASVVKTKGRSTAAVTALLKYIRTHKLRESKLVVQYGKPLVQGGGGSALGDEKWTVLEQVFIAALDTKDMDLADACLRGLHTQFPDSARVKRLVGMKSEAERDYTAALQIYDELLEANPANQLAMKRKICILRADNKVQSAIHELNEYIKRFQADASAWQELADLYLSVAKYDSAAFCYEELILHNPMSHLLHCRLGEIYYTLGKENLTVARKHFCKSLELKRKDNPRALHGLRSCCSALASGEERLADPSVNAALSAYAARDLRDMYQATADPVLAGALETVLESDSATAPGGTLSAE